MNTSLTADTLMGVQPTKIGDYQLNPVQVQKTNCLETVVFPNVGFNCNVVNEKLTSVENESTLFGLDRPITKQEPVVEPKVESTTNEFKSSSMKTSFNLLEPEWTRQQLSCNLPGVQFDRFESPMHDAQKEKNIFFIESQRGGMNTSLYSKDCQISECGDLFKIKKNQYGNTCLK